VLADSRIQVDAQDAGRELGLSLLGLEPEQQEVELGVHTPREERVTEWV
jgi:hypothetical protein